MNEQTKLAELTSTIDVIGLGVADKAQLSNEAQCAIERADVVIGSERQLQVVSELLQPNQASVMLPPLRELKTQLLAYCDKHVVVLASGDPLYYGIGRWLINCFGLGPLTFHPAVSSIQAACHGLGLSLQDVEVLSLHGRPLEKIRTRLKKNHRLVILTDKHSTPVALAHECVQAGFAQSTLWVCERLGYPEQNIRQFTAEQLGFHKTSALQIEGHKTSVQKTEGQKEGAQELDDKGTTYDFDPLHVTVIETHGAGGVLPEFPGIADHLFVTDKEAGKGMITKREVRLAILSLLQPSNEDVIWDIGAGCGSVAIELSYWAANASVYAIEHHPERLSCLEQNRVRFGVVSNLSVIEGRAPQQLTDLPMANKIFIGGSDGNLAELLTIGWQQLPEGGMLVASAVTENTKYQLHAFAATLAPEQTETLQIAVSKGATLAGQLMYKPNLPVTLFKFIKSNGWA